MKIKFSINQAFKRMKNETIISCMFNNLLLKIKKEYKK